jgi:hypothetical protein
MRIMINNDDGNNNDLDRPSVFLNDIPSFLIIAFMVSLITAALINTQPGMKSIADVLAFFALGYLIIGIAGQLISLRK